MTKLQHIIRYVCANYPHSGELSNARLTKLIYLADWKFAQDYERQISTIDWYFDRFGPYVNDVASAAKLDERLSVCETETIYGTKKILINFKPDKRPGKLKLLSKEEKRALDSVMEDTKHMYWNTFIDHVYNTFPVHNNDRYTTLNLVDQANLEKELVRNE